MTQTMTRHKWHKGLALLLAIVMCLSLLPGLSMTVKAATANALGISGYTSGADWDIEASKSLDIDLKELPSGTGETQYVKIELAEGMRFASYIWNTDWGTVPAGVLGTAGEMTDTYKGYLSGNEISVDASGKTTLIYEISEDTDKVVLSGQVSVKPNEYLSYNTDTIYDAVKISILDKNKNTISGITPVAYDVYVTADMSRNGFGLGRWVAADGPCLPGSEDVLLFHMVLHKRYANVNYYPLSGHKVDEIVVPIHEDVTEVTRVTRRSTYGKEITDEQWTWDPASHTVTIRNHEYSEEGFVEHNHNLAFAIYGNISADAEKGLKNTTEFTYYSFKAYDGTLIDKNNTDYWYNNSPGVRTFVRISGAGEKTDVMILGDASASTATVAQPPEGYAIPLTFCVDYNNFYATEELTEDQIITWEIPENTLDVVGAMFPKGNDPVTITKVVFDNGFTIENPGLSFTEPNTYRNAANKVYVTVAALKAANSTIPTSAKYIRSITANCGKFASDFVAGMSGDYAGYVSGRFNQAIVDQGKAQTIEYKYIVNGVETVVPSYYTPAPRASVVVRPTASSSFVSAGDDVTFETMLYGNGWKFNATKEPKLYFVVPDGFLFNPADVTAKVRIDGVMSDVAKDRIKYSAAEVYAADDTEKEHPFTVWTIYVQDSVITNWKPAKKSSPN